MARTDKACVESIIELDESLIPDNFALAPFIATANALVNDACTGSAGPPTPYTDERLELIERWLTAHLYTNADPRATDEKAGSVSVKYQAATDLGFDTSHYGQTAMRLDTNGGLAKLNHNTKKGGSKVGGFWAGRKEASG